MIEKILNKTAIDYYNISNSLYNTFEEVKYTFMPNEEFLKLKDPKEINYIYWIEMIQRTHIASITSIFRNKFWIEGLLISYSNNHFYSFAANLRELVESCSDSFYTVRNLPYTISENFSLISQALSCNLPRVAVAKEMEDSLIHYSYARKLKKEEKGLYSKEHNAEAVQTYLQSITKLNEGVLDLYSYLCQISHPSYLSLSPFLIEDNNDLYILRRKEAPLLLCETLIKKYTNEICKTIEYGTFTSLITLKLINKFNIEALKSSETVLQILDGTPMWNKCITKIKN